MFHGMEKGRASGAGWRGMFEHLGILVCETINFVVSCKGTTISWRGEHFIFSPESSVSPMNDMTVGEAGVLVSARQDDCPLVESRRI